MTLSRATSLAAFLKKLEKRNARAIWEAGIPRFEALLAAYENLNTHMFLGLIYAKLGRRTQALEHARRALEISPGDPWGLYLKGKIHSILGETREAGATLREAVAKGFGDLGMLADDQRYLIGLYNLRYDAKCR